MKLCIALAGNPNCGKTTLFNRLTGARQFVGNWPGVTVEKKVGRLLSREGVDIVDLPGIYSLSPYTPEELVARRFLLDGRPGEGPDVILNLVDAASLERSLYLTTQLAETGLPLVVAVNMAGELRKRGGRLDAALLSRRLSCPIVEISALRGDGVEAAVEAALLAARRGASPRLCRFDSAAEGALSRISAQLEGVAEARRRWYAVKLFERDAAAARQLSLPAGTLVQAEREVKAAERLLGEDSESILAAGRYDWIEGLLRGCYGRGARSEPTASDRIDRIATGRLTALPVFILIMLAVYFLSVAGVGGACAGWIEDGLFGEGWHLFSIGAAGYEAAADRYALAAAREEAFSAAAARAGLEPEAAVGLVAVCPLYDADGRPAGEVLVTYADYLAAAAERPPDPADWGVWVSGIPVLMARGLEAVGCADWLRSLLLDGLLAGVGAVLGFFPQITLLFFCLALLEGCGYMARIAFILDRVFRRFGLSGKSFIPMLVGSGCGVPGILASRTIESEADRRMTVLTTTFIPCSAKLPVISLLTGGLFGGGWWVAPSAYFAGIGAVLLSGLILKKSRLFSGDSAPFIMELPPYRLPTAGSLFSSLLDRVGGFLKKAGTVILLSSLLIWFSSRFGFADGGFGRVGMENSLLAAAGRGIAPLFRPLGWGCWQAAVATLSGLIAKENIVSTLGVLFGGEAGTAGGLSSAFSPLSGYAFLIFNLLCAPCVAAMDAIRRELRSLRLTVFAIGYQCAFAYLSALCVYQFGIFLAGGGFSSGTLAAVLTVLLAAVLLLRPSERGGGFA